MEHKTLFELKRSIGYKNIPVIIYSTSKMTVNAENVLVMAA
jgi:hypothetical protein